MDVQKNINRNISTLKKKRRVNIEYFDVNNPNNWIVNDGKGTITNNVYYKRNNWWKKNKQINEK
jgi:hypothetical protein